MEIRQLESTQIDNAITLIWETFLQFDAPDYSEEGVQSFKEFIENEEIIKSLEFFGAYDQGELEGVLATNENRKHICCFFVKAQYHRQGIGRKLWEYVLSSSKNNTFTVHSSPYAVPVYRKLGFVDTNTEQSADGMRYTPMKFER
ncbi:MAG TPA: GNAT family N-acetyltransferase [Candidatus Mediterraneibacter excrementipullorum]|nr:GNAT family N-acetyltransferase [Candidatus Mediterraneibacter excrementipullorum]